MFLQMFATVAKVIATFGKPVKKGGNRDEVVKVALKSFDGRIGLDIRDWYMGDKEKAIANGKEAEYNANVDTNGYLPGKGIFLPITHVHWLAGKLAECEANEEYQKLLKAAVETKKESEVKDSKLAKENDELKTQMAAMQRQMAELMAAMGGKAEPKKDEPKTEGLEEIIPGDLLANVTPPKGKGKKS